MSHAISKTNLINDCYLLFGSKIFNYIDFLKNLSPSELKVAYRKKAFETHPDRAQTLGEDEDDMDERFKGVITAYERLNSFIQGDKKCVLEDELLKKKNNKKTNHTQRNQKSVSDHFYKSYIPKRKLLFGQFLYYSGLVSWRTLFDAISWQRRQRPLIGQIALDWGILSSDEIQRILTERSYKENFGEYALRKGYITYFEFSAIIGKQKMLQRPIGEYFLQQGILCRSEIEKMIERLKNHNRKVLVNDIGSFCYKSSKFSPFRLF